MSYVYSCPHCEVPLAPESPQRISCLKCGRWFSTHQTRPNCQDPYIPPEEKTLTEVKIPPKEHRLEWPNHARDPRWDDDYFLQGWGGL